MSVFWGLDDPIFDTLSTRRRMIHFRDRVFDRDGGLCQLCGKTVERVLMHLDHIKPVSLGGGDTWDNVRIAHQSCNSRRGNTISRRNQTASKGNRKETVSTSVRLSVEAVELIRCMAKSNGISRVSVIETLIRKEARALGIKVPVAAHTATSGDAHAAESG